MVSWSREYRYHRTLLWSFDVYDEKDNYVCEILVVVSRDKAISLSQRQLLFSCRRFGVGGGIFLKPWERVARWTPISIKIPYCSTDKMLSCTLRALWISDTWGISLSFDTCPAFSAADATSAHRGVLTNTNCAASDVGSTWKVMSTLCSYWCCTAIRYPTTPSYCFQTH